MAEKTDKPQNATITGVVSQEMRATIEDYRWDNRMKLSEVVREAFDVWAQAKGLVTPETPATPDEASDKSSRKR